MSSTTTTTATTLSILADYELHHSGIEHSSNPTQSNGQTTSSTSSASAPQSQPLTWPTNYRRVPAYRPINRNLDQAERAAGANVPEYIFIQSMMHGVWLNASIAQFWNATGGKINDKLFRCDIGGEY
ncbi:hypothetical protein BJX99DRAFT_16341 [Aspergillus californicus]